MPELPDILIYQEALTRRLLGQVLRRVSIVGPALLETHDPPITAAEGRCVTGVERLGKRLVLVLESDLFLVLHLMIAGRLRWDERGGRTPAKVGLASFRFDHGALHLVEASAQKRARLHLVSGRSALLALGGRGRSVFAVEAPEFLKLLQQRSRTLKRALTDPECLDGIGNAYSDEILHAARLAPTSLTGRLDLEGAERLLRASRSVLTEWTDRLRAATGDGFPSKVTAFREGMAVHGRYGKPCPVCSATVERIVRGEHETNYCPGCQTKGRLLADRTLSRLDRGVRPATAAEKAERMARHRRLLAEPLPPDRARGDPTRTETPPPSRRRRRVSDPPSGNAG